VLLVPRGSLSPGASCRSERSALTGHLAQPGPVAISRRRSGIAERPSRRLPRPRGQRDPPSGFPPLLRSCTPRGYGRPSTQALANACTTAARRRTRKPEGRPRPGYAADRMDQPRKGWPVKEGFDRRFMEQVTGPSDSMGSQSRCSRRHTSCRAAAPSAQQCESGHAPALRRCCRTTDHIQNR
jgi:hypothetical protein